MFQKSLRALDSGGKNGSISLQLDQTDYATKTDAKGHFSSPKVPPGHNSNFWEAMW
jgi:hypothetical protein